MNLRNNLRHKHLCHRSHTHVYCSKKMEMIVLFDREIYAERFFEIEYTAMEFFKMKGLAHYLKSMTFLPLKSDANNTIIQSIYRVKHVKCKT